MEDFMEVNFKLLLTNTINVAFDKINIYIYIYHQEAATITTGSFIEISLGHCLLCDSETAEITSTIRRQNS
jgi:hypothetical protein